MKPVPLHRTAVILLALALGGCGGSDHAVDVASARTQLAMGDRAGAIVILKNVIRDDPGRADARYLMGRALRAASDPVGAEVELRRAHDLGHDRNLVVPELVGALFDAGTYRKAVEESEGAPIAPATAQALVFAIRGDAHVALQNLAQARAAYESALELDPESTRAKLGLARRALTNGDIGGSTNFVSEVLAADPTSGDAWALKGSIAQQRGDLDEAVTAFAKAVDVQPAELRSHVDLISLLLARGRVDDAASRLAAMKKIGPLALPTGYANALVAYARGNATEARNAIRAVLRYAPEDRRATLLGGSIEHDVGNYAMAEKLLGNVLEAEPGSMPGRVMLASTYARSGRTAKARATLAPLLATSGPGAAVLVLAGEVALLEHEPAVALGYLERATTIAPESIPGRVALARARIAAGQFDRGIADLATVTATAPAQAASDVLMIESFLARGQHDAARKTADALVVRLPGDARARNALGFVAIAQGDKVAAREAFEKALQLSPDSLPAIRALAALEMEAGNDAGAVGKLNAFVARDRGRPDGVVLLVATMQQTGAPAADVIAILDGAIRTNTGSAVLPVLKTDYLLSRGDARGALDAARLGQAGIPDDPAMIYALARAQQASGELRQSLSSYARLASVAPDSALSYLGRAEVHAAERNWGAARDALRRAITIEPAQWPAYRALADVGMRSGDYAKARSDARLLQTKWPARPEGYLIEADALSALKDPAAAETVLRTALDPTGSPAVLAALYELLLADKGSDRAERQVVAWSAKRPGDVRGMLAAGDVHQRRAEPAAAEAWFRRALAVRPEDPVVLNNLAWVLGKRGDPAALAFGNRALVRLPRQPEVLDTVGVLNVQFGHLEDGIRQLKHAVALSPASAPTRRHLAEALAKAGRPAEAGEHLAAATQLTRDDGRSGPADKPTAVR